MKKLFAVMSMMMTMAAAPVSALELQEARAQGAVGETQAGYVAKITGGEDVAALVADVNLKRRAEYERISAENGQSVDVVAKIAAGKIITGLPKGAQYKDTGGKWAQK
jgi:uncharacterized protein YdbL (DUF1318 family)